MDIKLIKNKNLIALAICFCISVISFNLENVDMYIPNLDKDFYKSYQLEQTLYEIATNSVYTVVGDNASEKMLGYRRTSRDIISNHTLAPIYTINNDSKEVYSNIVFDFDEYMKILKTNSNYPYIYEINFKQNTMYLLEGNEKIRVSTKHFGNIAQKRKEDVTTYIAIPYISMISGIKDTNNNDPLYRSFESFYKNVVYAYTLIGSKIIAIIILLVCLGIYTSNNKKQDKKIMLSNLRRIILLIIIAFALSFLQYRLYGPSIFYSIINTGLIYIGYILLEYKRKDILEEKITFIKKLGQLQIKDIKVGTLLKSMWVIIVIILAQFVLTIMVIDMTYSWYDDYIVVLVWCGIIALPIALIWIIANKIKKIEKIKDGVNEIKNGNLDYKINIKKDTILDDIVNDINEIGQAINIAVEDRLKSERMKNELITNVSHDLKTPLTAMINYISLMKKEDIQPEHIKDYVQVLDKRSQRLKLLIEDLFEASKIGSNNIELNLEPNDINQLLAQTLVEMEEYIDDSKLDFILNVPEHEVYTLADGKKTFRVFENIISNILKYSLEGTRVYIDLQEKNNKINISFKNISKYQLNFDPNEITERFTRGDLSRNTEGSGLGLAIAKGFIQAQGGSLTVDIIGDLFIVNVELNSIEN